MKLRPESDLREQQILIRDAMESAAALLIVLGMGGGKSGAALTAILRLLVARKVRRVLIIAPLRVARDTWPDEIRTWEHTHRLRFSLAVGTEAQRRAAIDADTPVTIINREMLPWLFKHLKLTATNVRGWKYDCVVVDESSMFKAGKIKTAKVKKKTIKVIESDIDCSQIYDFHEHGELISVRLLDDTVCELDDEYNVEYEYTPMGLSFGVDHERLFGTEKRLRLTFQKTTVRPGGNLTRFGVLAMCRKMIKRIYLLTGTPAPNGIWDLWGQIYLLDQGARLKRSFNAFKNEFFHENPKTFELKPRDGAIEYITKKVSDVMFSLPPPKEVPKPVFIPVPVKLSAAVLAEYKLFAKTMVSLAYDVNAVNRGVLTMKLMQFANGHMYREDKSVVPVHTEKFDALDELIERAAGEPVLIWYGFKFDLAEIRRRYPHAVVFSEDDDAIQKWNRGEIKIGIAHPATLGHGINLQYGGHIAIWFGLTWSLELYLQANARLARPGQKHLVAIYQIIAEGTVDEDAIDVLDSRDADQKTLTARVVRSVVGDDPVELEPEDSLFG